VTSILLDTGPLVAYLYPRDGHHDWVVAQFASFEPPFLTCEPVIAEACFLLSRNRISPQRALGLIRRGLVRIDLQLGEEIGPVIDAMDRYANVPMSLADACIVRLAERTGWPIFTLDSDFGIYRTRRGRPLEIISPPGARGLHEP
jgi:uncharacterized protein